MQTRRRIFDDLAKVASSAAGTFAGLKDEIEALVRQRLEVALNNMNLVTREEFDAVKAVATKARQEQEKLEKRLAKLEGGTKKPNKPAASTKPANKKAAAKKKAAGKKK